MTTSMMVGFAYTLRRTLISVLMYPQTMTWHLQISSVDHHIMMEREMVVMKKRETNISLNKYQVLPKYTLCYKIVKSFFQKHSIAVHV
jgi:hypothetical protein